MWPYKLAAGLGFSVLVVACARGVPISARPAPARAEVTLLFTTDEHGWLLPHTDRGRERGGAATMLGRWVAEEGHCPGPPSPRCQDPATLALSGGDNYTGPAISTFFHGAPMAEVMARMGYAASAFGNHEFDFGRVHFLENRSTSGMVYLAANLHAPPSLPEMALPPFAIFERRGIKIGVVGLATETTLRTAMASRFEGITFEAEEPALHRAVHGAWAAGADAVVALIHECPDLVAPMVERHPEWKLSFVGAGHCHKQMLLKPLGVPVISPGWRLDRYARVRMTVDLNRPVGARMVAVSPDIVEVSHAEGAPPLSPPDPTIERMAAAWKANVDTALGEEIGWTSVGFEKDSPEMGQWIAGALREEMGTDVAIVNASGLRQNLPQGPITKASVWSILPFDNRLLVVRLSGSALAENLRHREAVASGATRGPTGSFWVGGRPIDPEQVYSVTTVDFLYFGGDRFTFKEHAVSMDDRGVDWRDTVIAWTKKQHTSRDAPLEERLREGLR